MTARTEGGRVDVATGWKSRQMGTQRFADTYDNYTKPVSPKIDKSRISRLITGETKGRQFNPLTGNTHFLSNYTVQK